MSVIAATDRTGLGRTVVLLLALSLAAACQTTDPDRVVVERDSKADWADLQVDKSMSCQGACDSVVVDALAGTYCGCDSACASLDDCCDDRAATCDSQPGCDYADPDRSYAGKSPAECSALDIDQCSDGFRIFNDSCGCGCEKCTHDEPDLRYVGTSLSACMAMRFACEAGEEYFQNECGCGCKQVAQPGCDYADPDRSYAGKSPAECSALDIDECSDGFRIFNDSCGCGCEKCTYDEPDLRYIGTSPSACMTMLIGCEAGEEYFENECGCGCKQVAQLACDYDDPYRRYVGTSPSACMAMLIGCDEGEEHFEDECGCGCQQQLFCGGVAGEFCPAGYTCQFDGYSLAGKCVKQHPLFCGGIAGVPCPAGYTCELDGDYPDAGGKCVQQP